MTKVGLATIVHAEFDPGLTQNLGISEEVLLEELRAAIGRLGTIKRGEERTFVIHAQEGLVPGKPESEALIQRVADRLMKLGCDLPQISFED